MFKVNNFTPCSSVSNINFDHVIAGWVIGYKIYRNVHSNQVHYFTLKETYIEDIRKKTYKTYFETFLIFYCFFHQK